MVGLKDKMDVHNQDISEINLPTLSIYQKTDVDKPSYHHSLQKFEPFL